MSDEPVTVSKRRPGRPRKNVQHPNSILLNNNRQPEQRKRKQSLLQSTTDDIKVIDLANGLQAYTKKPKIEDDNLQPRAQPHRAARFTDSYGGGSPDVVVLSDDNKDDDSESESDSDCSLMPSPIAPNRTAEEDLQLQNHIQKLKKQLCDEEMKLVLLRKLKESQKSKETKVETDTCTPSIRPNLVQKETVSSERSSSSSLNLPSKHLLSTNKYVIRQQQVKKPDPVASNIPSVHQKRSLPVQNPVKVEVSNHPQSVPSSIASQKQFGINQYPLLKNLSNQITITPVSEAKTTIANTSSVPKRDEKQDAEALAQRQASAKLALRKQLEKTLLQIPLPKPPPFRLGFFPNGNCIEFLCLLGLDVAVDFMTKSKKATAAVNNKNPLTCSQCKTDFTSMWKWKEIVKHGKKEYHVYCEACITSNMRKALKAEHTNNLKSAFLKALQQEKEIDRLSLATAKSHTPIEAPSSSKPQKAPLPAHQSKTTHHHHHHQQQQQQQQHHIPKTTSSSISMSHSIPNPKSIGAAVPNHHGGSVADMWNMNHALLAQQVAKLNPQLQSLLQAQAQNLLASGVPLHPNLLTLSQFRPQLHHHMSRGKPASGQNDLRRQYNSERVRSPIPQAKASWHA